MGKKDTNEYGGIFVGAGPDRGIHSSAPFMRGPSRILSIPKAENYLIRPAGPDDFVQGFAIAKELNGGMTSWPASQEVIRSKLDRSAGTFAGTVKGDDRVYLLALQTPEGEIMGMAGIYPQAESVWPSWVVEGKGDEAVIAPHLNTLGGATELGTTFLRQKFRSASGDKFYSGWGKALSLSRFMLIANDTERFEDTIFAEYRGPLDKSGTPVAGEWFAKKYFGCDFDTLDRRIGEEGYEAVFSGMFKSIDPHKIQDLPKAVRESLHECHPNTRPARAILEDEGVVHDDRTGVHDFGPQAIGTTRELRTVRQSRLLEVGSVVTKIFGNRALISTADIDANFKATFASASVAPETPGVITLEGATAAVLGVAKGDVVRVGPDMFTGHEFRAV